LLTTHFASIITEKLYCYSGNQGSSPEKQIFRPTANYISH